MSEKESPIGPVGEKDIGYGEAKVPATRRRSSAVNPEILHGELFDERYETTQRGLKSR
jgi:amino acid transporter